MQDPAGTSTMSQSTAFKKPPVDEVVVSTYFNPPLSDLRSEHIGLFWGRIKERFPVVRQQPPVMSQPSPAEMVPSINVDEPFPMPRYWIVSADETELIQIQKNAFMFNWRRRDDGYPRFHKHIKPEFDGYYGLFSEFVRTEIHRTEPLIDLCELTYINVLEPCEYWTGPQDTRKVIPGFSILAPDLAPSESAGFVCNYGYRVTNDLHLNIGICTGVRIRQPDVAVLMFEFKAGGRLGQVAKSGVDAWFERAHDAIFRCFLSLTSRDIQNRYWEPTETMQ